MFSTSLELHRAINDGASDRAFGGVVAKSHLPCIYLSGEDDRVTLDHRLKSIRQGSKKQPAEHGLLIPAPNIGPMPLVRENYDGLILATDVYAWLDEQLSSQRAMFGELGFLAVDTWSTFFPIDANDNSKVQAAISLMAQLATKHDVCIIITHHLSKGSDQSTRGAIRGASALVDGSRGAYTFYRAKEDEARFVLGKLHEADHMGDVLKLRLVKNNLGLQRDEITFVRQEDGRLRDVSCLLRDDTSPDDALIQIVASFNAAGVKVAKSGRTGLFTLKGSDWPPVLMRMGRDKLESLTTRLIMQGRLAIEDKRGGGLVVT